MREQYGSKQNLNASLSQRQLRVGELVKQNIGEIFIRNESKIPSFDSKLITVTEVRMTPDLKTIIGFTLFTWRSIIRNC